MYNKTILFIFFLMAIMISPIYSQSLSTSPLSVCVQSGSTNVPVTVTASGLPGGTVSTSWTVSSGATKGTTTKTTANISVDMVAYTYPGSITIKADFFDNTPKNIGSATYTLNVDYYEPAFAEKSPGTIISMLNTDNPYNLRSLLNEPSWYYSSPANGKIEFCLTSSYGTTTSLITNTSSSNAFNPIHASAPLPATYFVSYRIYYNGCKSPWIDISNKIKVFDGSGALPYFIQPVTSVPICQNTTVFAFDVLSNCPNGCTLTPTYKSGTPTAISNPQYVQYWYAQDSYNQLYKYRFTINPSYVDPTKFSIPIAVDDPCYAVGINGYIPIQINTNLSIYGTPTPVGSNVSICSASLDTMFMQGGPGGGYFRIYKSSPAAPAKVLVATTPFPSLGGATGSDLYPQYRNAGQDQSLQKIIPYELFSNVNYANSDPTVTFRVVYIYSKFTSGACSDSTIINLNFLTPNTTDYSIIAPNSVATTPLTTYCYGDTLNLAIVGAPGNYTWYLSDGYIKQTTATKFSYLFGSPGVYTIRLKSSATALSPGQCSNDVIRSIRVGAKPTANFDVFNNFAVQPPAPAKFKDLSGLKTPNLYAKNIPAMQQDTINRWKWDFGDNIIGTNTKHGDTLHSYNATTYNPYKVIFTATSGWGCKDSITRYIPAFPVYTPTDILPYTQDFNSVASANGFYQSGQYLLANTVSSWVNQPAVGKVIKSSDPCWITSKAETKPDTTGYFNNEHSWIESPCLDLSTISLPMVSMDTWSQTDKLFDGATVQYTLCDSAFGKEKWVTLGDANSGLNWYNTNIIISSPGGTPALGTNLYGWTGTDNKKGWNNSAFSLSAAKDSAKKYNVPYIRIRVGFSSNNDNTPGETFDGFAFDNFFVGQRNRNILIEEFCDYNHTESGFETAPFNKNPQLIRMQYHTRYMALDDEINNQNIGETGARNLLYGVSALPRAAVDGYYSNDTENPFFGGIGKQNYDRRLLQTSPFTIQFNTPTVSGNALNFSVNMIRDTKLGNKGPFTLQVAVLEDLVLANGKSFSNVFRKFLPYAAGEHVDMDDWQTGSANAKILNRSFTPFAALTPRNDSDTSLILVAFIQDETTSEIYQSEAYYLKYGVVKSLTKIPLPQRISKAEIGISLYPNPAQTELTVKFDQGAAVENYVYHVVDAYGQILLNGNIAQDSQEANIAGIQNLPVGVYQLQLQSNTSSQTSTFTIVR
jgi:hypothetical protein